MKKTHSTVQAAKLAKIHWTTLHRWLRSGAIRPSISVPLNGKTLWRWTDADVERVRRYKQENYRKGRGRKAKGGRK